MKRNKIISTLMVAVMTLTLVFANVSLVSAAEPEVNSELQEAPELTAEVPDIPTVSREKQYANSVSSTTLTAKLMTYSTTKAPDFEAAIIEPGYGINKWPIKVSSTGNMYLDIVVYGQVAGDYVTIMVYDQKGKSMDIGWQLTVNTPGEYVGGTSYPIGVKSGTYSLRVETPETNVGEVTVAVRGRVYLTSNRTTTLKANTWMVSSGIKRSTSYGEENLKETEIMYKIKPTKTGLIQVYVDEVGKDISEAYITLYNSKKKAVSKPIYYTSQEERGVFFGVQKGSTYYIKVTKASGTEEYFSQYAVMYGIDSFTSRSISSKSKAKTVSRYKTVNTLFPASTSSNTDYYKIKVGSKRETVIGFDVSAIESGTLSVSVYRGSKKIGRTQTINCANTDGEAYYITYGKTNGKANSGTYYIKVVKNKYASGVYGVSYIK